MVLLFLLWRVRIAVVPQSLLDALDLADERGIARYRSLFGGANEPVGLREAVNRDQATVVGGNVPAIPVVPGDEALDEPVHEKLPHARRGEDPIRDGSSVIEAVRSTWYGG